jgi:hypothetical protein
MILRILPIITLIFLMWVMIFAGSYAIFRIIVPLNDFYPGLEGRIVTSIFKVGTSGVLVIFWMFLMWKIRNFFVKRNLLYRSEG